MFKSEHIKRAYESKCRKYPPADLTEDFKKQLYTEAVNEVNTMACVSLKAND